MASSARGICDETAGEGEVGIMGVSIESCDVVAGIQAVKTQLDTRRKSINLDVCLIIE